jgi:D-alanyl-D-alanine carboxypeptidase/D-alanyl-D-alanine-endopeptidase (penicillin-binding protein 4)
MKPGHQLYFLLLIIFHFSACTGYRRLARSADKMVLHAPSLQAAHVGISIYEPATGKYWYNHQGDKYFVPASNTKIPTCYAAMKYLGDSITAGHYLVQGNSLLFQPAGDPGFLLSEFPNQPLLRLFERFDTIRIWDDNWQEERWGNGWSWNDYEEPYMAERSPMPLYGNVMTIIPDTSGALPVFGPDIKKAFSTIPRYFHDQKKFTVTADITQWSGPANPASKISPQADSIYFRMSRAIAGNEFTALPSFSKPVKQTISFYTGSFSDLQVMLADTLHKNAGQILRGNTGTAYMQFDKRKGLRIRSQPADSLFRPMMHRSDNFFAEQSLLMVSNELLGIMNDARIIDTLVRTDFKDLPQRPRWVDGSGLSRYNLFTPQDFVAILNKMRTDFGMDRVKNIFATGNEGTLSNYYRSSAGKIFAKTGTLSGVVALSGFLYTKKNRLLVFSLLVNNHQSSATDVRRAVESFIEGIRERY